jgi:hypothetical protein
MGEGSGIYQVSRGAAGSITVAISRPNNLKCGDTPLETGLSRMKVLRTSHSMIALGAQSLAPGTDEFCASCFCVNKSETGSPRRLFVHGANFRLAGNLGIE